MNNPILDEEELPTEESWFEHHAFIVDKGQEPLRIDKWLQVRIANATRSKIQAGIEAGCVLVNNKPIKSNYKVRGLDDVRVVLSEPPRDTEVYPENIPLEVKYEDTDILIINKKAGMVVHPGCNNYSGTLVNALVYHFGNLPQQNENHRPGLVHRIDKDTSGLLVIGKNEFALSFLGKQFFDHSIDRKYWALVWGEPAEESGTIRGYLARDPADRRKSKHYTDPEMGKEAITHYKIIEKFYFLTLVECTLETGRTHQIRAHFTAIGHPLFSDEMYGGNEIRKGTSLAKFKSFIQNCFTMMPRQALHAKELGFIHPTTKEYVFFNSELPPDFAGILEKLRNYVKANLGELTIDR